MDFALFCKCETGAMHDLLGNGRCIFILLVTCCM